MMMSIRSLFAVFAFALLAACTTPQTPPGSDGGTAPPITNVPGSAPCTLLDGIDSSGTLRTICADIIEVGIAVAFISTLRSTMTDAGNNPRIAAPCIQMQSICATSQERAAAIVFLSATRDAKLKLDAGMR